MQFHRALSRWLLADQIRIVPAIRHCRFLFLVSDDHAEIIKSEKRLLGKIRNLLDPLLDPVPADLETLDTCARQLSDLFCITVIGEFNCGKSTFVNALLGKRICEEGVTPTTSSVNCIRFDDAFFNEESSSLAQRRLPWLKDVVIVDTPGTNAIISGHQEITENIIPRSDLVFFLTSVDRPFSESERVFMNKIYEWRRKIVFVINKIDMLDNMTRTSDLDKVVHFIRNNTQQQLQLSPPIFAVSGKTELNAKLFGYSSSSDSGFQALEAFISETLSDDAKLRLKLENPLGVSEFLLDKYESVLQEKLEISNLERSNIQNMLNDLKHAQQYIRSAFELQNSRIENVLIRLLHRVDDFLAEHIRISNITNLLRANQLSKAFEQEVICGFTSEVHRVVIDASDWLQDQIFARIQSLFVNYDQHISLTNRAEGTSFLSSEARSLLSSDRRTFHSDLRSEIQASLQRYEDHQVAKFMADSVRTALLASLTFEISAIAAAAATSFPSGLIGITALAIGGFVVLPYQKRELGRHIRHQVLGSQRQLLSILNHHLDLELQRSSGLLMEAIHPLIRRNNEDLNLLNSAKEAMSQLRKEINRIRCSTDSNSHTETN